MKSLLKITENIVEKNLSRLGSIQNHIFFNWAHIAGQYADITIPHKIKFGRKKKYRWPNNNQSPKWLRTGSSIRNSTSIGSN